MLGAAAYFLSTCPNAKMPLDNKYPDRTRSRATMCPDSGSLSRLVANLR